MHSSAPHVAAQHLAVGVDRHMLLASNMPCLPPCFDEGLQIGLDASGDVARIHLHRVEKGLVVEQLLLHEGLQRLVHRLAVRREAHLAVLTCKLLGAYAVYVGVEYRRATNNGGNLVEHDLTSLLRAKVIRGAPLQVWQSWAARGADVESVVSFVIMVYPFCVIYLNLQQLMALVYSLSHVEYCRQPLLAHQASSINLAYSTPRQEMVVQGV